VVHTDNIEDIFKYFQKISKYKIVGHGGQNCQFLAQNEIEKRHLLVLGRSQ
jgi:hypothetical protein